MKAVCRYLGAKNRLATWIISHFPEHTCYVEPFGGSAAILLNKKPAKIEIYNDKYSRIVNFFRTIRNHPEELSRLVELTPYAQDEYKTSHQTTENQIEDARRFAVQNMMAYGMQEGGSGFRRGGLLRHTPCPQTWRNYPDIIRECAANLRSRNLEINNTDALAIMKTYDSPDTLHYVDPPYLPTLRKSKYKHEFSTEDHQHLLEFLLNLKGKIIISGYQNDIYTSKLANWRTETKEAITTSGKRKKEYLWMNYQPE